MQFRRYALVCLATTAAATFLVLAAPPPAARAQTAPTPRPESASEGRSIAPGPEADAPDQANPQAAESSGDRPLAAQRPVTDSDSSGDAIEVITVTARRREEKLQSTPVSVSAFSQLDLVDIGAVRIDDIGHYVPNLQFDSGGAGRASAARAFIRGIGDLESPNLWYDPGVGKYLDGVYLARAQGALLSVVDIERIEVLRGPQGTLFGRNTIAGAINVITRKPGPHFEAWADFTAASHGRILGRGAVNVPLIEDELFSRISFAAGKRDGFTTNRFDGSSWDDDSLYAVNGALRWLATEALTVDLAGSWSRENERNRGGECRLIENPDGTQAGDSGTLAMFAFNAAVPGLPDYLQSCADAEALPHRRFRHNQRGEDDLKQYDARLALDWSMDSIISDIEGWDRLSLKSITAYRRQGPDFAVDYDWSEDTVLHIETVGRALQQQASTELQLNTAAFDHRLDIVAGFYASWAWAEGPQHLTILDGFEIPLFTDGSLAGTVPALRSNVNENRRRDSSFAGYTQIRFDVTDFFALTAGARYTAETKRVDQRTTLTAPSFSHNINEFFGAPVRCDVGSPGTPSCVTYDVGRVVKDKSGRESYDAWTPMANLAFTPRRAWLPNGVDQALLYYNYAEGFKGGGVSTAEQNDPFDPEFAYSHEVGVRSTWWGNRLVANFSFFLTDYTDIQYTVLDVNPSSGIVERAQRNIAEAKLRGFEIELRANPIRHLRLRGSLGYIDADLVEFPDTISFSGTEPPGQCAGDIVINEGTGAGSCTIDRSDEDWYNTPKLTASASIEYNIPMGGLWGQLVPRVDFYFQDDVRYAASSTAFLSGRNTQDAFSLWSFRLTWYPDLWREGSKNLRISAFLDNAFDREYFNDGFDLAASFGSSGMYFGPPRTYGVTVRYDFP